MNPALPKMKAPWNMRPRSPGRRSSFASSHIDAISSAYSRIVMPMIAAEANRSARVVPEMALENTSIGMPTLRISRHMPCNDSSFSNFVLTHTAPTASMTPMPISWFNTTENCCMLPPSFFGATT